jgi:hypothetical protein
MSPDDILKLLKKNVSELLNEIKQNIFTSPSEQADIAMAEFGISCIPERDLMQNIIQTVLPFSEQIRKRDINFFTSQKYTIFEGLPTDRVDYFEKLIITPENQGGMSNEDKDVIFEYFDQFVTLAEEYKKNL